MPKNIKPAEFDIDAWLTGASKPSRSVKLYQRGDLLAELDEMADRIAVAEAIPEAEQSLADSPARLRNRYAELAEEFHNSALTIRLHGHTKEESETFGEGFDLSTDDGKRAAGFAVLADAIYEPKMSAEQIERLEAVVGDAQFSQVLAAHRSASNSILIPSADFLPKRSTEDEAPER